MHEQCGFHVRDTPVSCSIGLQVSIFGGSIWEWNDERQAYYLHQFTRQQPDLNYYNDALVQEMKVHKGAKVLYACSLVLGYR